VYIQNASTTIDFCMVATAGTADAAATVAARRLLDGVGPTSCVGQVINRGAGWYTLVCDSTDTNGKAVGLYFTASGDVPVSFTFPTTTANPHDNVAFGLSRLDSNISTRMGATPLINNLANLDSAVSSRMGTFTLPTNFAFLGLSSTGHVSNVDTLQIYTSNTPQSGDSFPKVNLNLDSTVSSRMGTFTLPVRFPLLAIDASGQVTMGTAAAGSIGSTAFTTAALNAMADALLDRNMATGTDSGTNAVRTVRQALRVLRNKVDTTTGIVFKEDDTTTSFTFSVTTAAGNPITIFDPADV
jgi:hypothetical protein